MTMISSEKVCTVNFNCVQIPSSAISNYLVFQLDRNFYYTYILRVRYLFKKISL